MFILAEDFEILGFTQEKPVLLYFGGSGVWLNGGNFIIFLSLCQYFYIISKCFCLTFRAVFYKICKI